MLPEILVFQETPSTRKSSADLDPPKTLDAKSTNSRIQFFPKRCNRLGTRPLYAVGNSSHRICPRTRKRATMHFVTLPPKIASICMFEQCSHMQTSALT